MSYLRALALKMQRPRPAIAPKLVGPAAPFGLEELVEEKLVISARRPSPMPPRPAEKSAPAMLPPRTPIAAASIGNGLKTDEPASTLAADPIRRSVQPSLEAPPSVEQTVSHLSRVVGHRMTAPPPAHVEVAIANEAPLAADRDERQLIVPRKLSGAAEPPPYPRVAPAQREQLAMSKRDDGRPNVQISIGRLEVRAHVAPPAKTERAQPFRPNLTLQDYLARRSGEH
jgi:hypothetical protein